MSLVLQGHEDWVPIASMVGRSAGSCERRWCNVLKGDHGELGCPLCAC